MPRKKSLNDLYSQASRIQKLASELGAKRDPNPLVVNGVGRPFQTDTTAGQRANKVFKGAMERARRIENSKQFKRDEANATITLNEEGWSEKAAHAASVPYTRKYGEYTQKGKDAYNANRKSQGLSAG